MIMNLKIFRIVFLVLLLIKGIYSISDKQIENAKEAIAAIYTITDLGKERFVGTGFFLSRNHFVTNFHVIDGLDNAYAKLSNGSSYEIAGVTDSNEKWDLVLLSVKLPSSVKIETLKLAKNYPRQGDDIYVIGHPKGFTHSVSDGIISAIRTLDEVQGRIIQITAPISSGNSGSPVLNKKSEVIGVATFYINDAQNLNFAIPFERIDVLKPGKLTPLQTKAVTNNLSKAIDYTTYSNSAYSISIPSQWNTVPESKLKQLSKMEGLVCAFSENDVSMKPYPYLTVAFKLVENITKEQVREIVSATDYDTTLIWKWDENSNSLYYSQCYKEYCFIGAIKFTNGGYLLFTLYSETLEDNFIDMAVKIFKSVSLDESVVFKSDETNLSQTAATEILEALGAISAQAIYATFMNIGTVADGYTNSSYTKEEAIEMIGAQMRMIEYCNGYIKKLNTSPFITGSDISYITQMIDVYNELHGYSSALNNYLKTSKNEFAEIFQNKRKTAYTKVANLLGWEKE